MEDNNSWKKFKTPAESFYFDGEPEVIHVIKTGFENKYMVVYEDAYEFMLGKTIFGTKLEIEEKFNINLGI